MSTSGIVGVDLCICYLFCVLCVVRPFLFGLLRKIILYSFDSSFECNCGLLFYADV